MSVQDYITYVGLDVHAKAINVAVICPGSDRIAEEWQVSHDDRSVRRLAKKLLEMGPGGVAAVYEAGPCGYHLKRQLDGLGIGCEVAAPSLVPVKPGDRVKTDRRDARKLATLYKGGLLTIVEPPNERQEALRDLMRAREDASKDLMAARHRISKMLLRYGLRFTQTKNWSKRYRAWLRQIRFDEAWAQQVFDNYLLAMEQVEERLKRLEAHIEEAAGDEAYAEQVGWLCCFRGINTITAMTVLAELHGVERFAHPRQLMAYLGLTPSEYSSGTRTRRGSVTKTGNGHVRRLLIEAVKSCRLRPGVSAVLRRRRAGQPAAVLAIADAAQHRLYQRYYHLTEGYHKPVNVAAMALARELAGFIWAALNHQGNTQSA
jgi:transposase